MRFPVIDLQGGPFERGRMHGRLAQARVERSVANYRALFGHCGIDWRDARRLGATYREAIGGFDALLLEEIEGIAEGAGRGVDEILALNVRTEILPPSFLERLSAAWLATQLGRPADFGECTAIAVLPERSGSGETLLAQNWDWLGSQRDALVILRARDPDGGGFMTLTEAGMLAKIGCNAAGLGVCLNILRSLDDGAAPGVPTHVLLRRLLGCGSVAEAERLLRTLRFGASSNILCADAGGHAASFELSPGGMDCIRPASGTLCHTNHFIAPDGRAQECAPPPSLSSAPRLARAQHCASSRARLGVGDLKDLLRDESDGLLSICRHPDPGIPEFARVESVASVVMELARGVMHVAPDVPSKVDYETISLASEAVTA